MHFKTTTKKETKNPHRKYFEKETSGVLCQYQRLVIDNWHQSVIVWNLVKITREQVSPL